MDIYTLPNVKQIASGKKPKSYRGAFPRRLTRSDPEFEDTEILNFETFNAQWKREVEMESGWVPGKCCRCLHLE